MNKFVLDNSVTMRWIFESEKKTDQKYAETVLKSLATLEALVPNLWALEVVNVLKNAVSKDESITKSDAELFLTSLSTLPILTDHLTARKAFNKTFDLAQLYNLSSYDAAYLELAIREGIPLATIDKDLVKAAKKSGVKIFEG